MTTTQQICSYLDEFAPPELAEDWDNVGLLVGEPHQVVHRAMTCLTITTETAAEAVSNEAELIITHHPLPFRPLKRITSQDPSGRLLLQLIKSGIAVYSPHTAFDSAASGINQQLAQRLQLTEPQPLKESQNGDSEVGTGRIARAPDNTTLFDLTERAKGTFGLERVQFVGDLDAPVTLVALACGAGGSMLSSAMATGCDSFVTGETTYHTCLEAAANGITMVLLGHYCSERFAVEMLAEQLNQAFSGIQVWASQREGDPIHWR